MSSCRTRIDCRGWDLRDRTSVQALDALVTVQIGHNCKSVKLEIGRGVADQ